MIHDLPRSPTLFTRPRPLVHVDLHPLACDCLSCEPYVPSVQPALDAVALGKLAVAGALAGTAIAFAIDAHGAAAALAACFGWAL